MKAIAEIENIFEESLKFFGTSTKWYSNKCSVINYFFLVEKCSIDNGGCSHGCENPDYEGEDVTCNCDGTKLVFDPNGDQKTCG